MTDVTSIIRAVLYIAGIILTLIVIPYVKQKYGEDKLSELKNRVKTLVSAAEQIYKLDPKSGSLKKEWVLSQIEKLGITYDYDEINALIEAAVRELYTE